MSSVSDLRAIEQLANREGLTVAQLLAWVARNAYGVDLRLPARTSDADIDAATLDELRETMGQLQDAVNALTAEAEEQRTQNASIVAYVRGVPELVATAVREALASVQTVDEAALASAVDAARTTISDSTDAALTAIAANTPQAATPSPTPVDTTASDPTPSPGETGVGDTPTNPQPPTDQPA